MQGKWQLANAASPLPVLLLQTTAPEKHCPPWSGSEDQNHAAAVKDWRASPIYPKLSCIDPRCQAISLLHPHMPPPKCHQHPYQLHYGSCSTQLVSQENQSHKLSPLSVLPHPRIHVPLSLFCKGFTDIRHQLSSSRNSGHIDLNAAEARRPRSSHP